MPAGEALDDDYIINLLKKDADDHKKRYSTVGNGPLLSAAKRRPDAPKPNTRFLKNIIRETDSHNAALKAKEESESKARLQELRRVENAGKRKREDDGGERNGKHRRERESRPGRWVSGSKARWQKRNETERPQPTEEDHESRGGERCTHRNSARRERSSEPSSRSNRRKSYRSERNRSRDRSRSPHHRKEHRRRHRSRSKTPPRTDAKAKALDDPDDPLTEFLGPQTLPRGRGALKTSGMDSRFREDYNPSNDVALEQDEEDDWDMALEALKARKKWRTQGAERLRAAGFAEEEVERWEKNGNGDGGGVEKDVEDVRWRKRGEGREWDRGKVLDDNGVELKADWAK